MAAEHDETVGVTGICCKILAVLRKYFANREISHSLDQIGPQSSFLHGEREIIDGNLQLCVDCPESIVTRILLARTLLSIKKVRPELSKEFKAKIELLQRKKPLFQPTQEILDNMIGELFAV
jgi:hypothetical protein